jgi:hypothetical protein
LLGSSNVTLTNKSVVMILVVLVMATWILSLLFYVRITWDRNYILLSDGEVRLWLRNGSPQSVEIHFGLASSLSARGFGIRLPCMYKGLFGDLRTFVVPIWVVLLPLIFVAILAHKRMRKPRPPQCKCCNYDLRGNMYGICPECGTATEALGSTPTTR